MMRREKLEHLVPSRLILGKHSLSGGGGGGGEQQEKISDGITKVLGVGQVTGELKRRMQMSGRS